MVGVFLDQGSDLCVKLWLDRLEKMTVANGILGVCADWTDAGPAALRLWIPNEEESEPKERDGSCVKNGCSQYNEE